MHYIGYQFKSTMLYKNLSRLQTYTVQANSVSVFMMRFMDLSNFSFFNFGHDFLYYSVENSPTVSEIQPPPGCFFKVMIRKSN